MNRVLWLPGDWDAVHTHFRAAGHREAGAFLLLRRGTGSVGCRLLVHRVLLPPEGALERQGPDALRPSGQWVSGVIGSAIEEECGLAFIHSHPNSAHPPNLSRLDWDTSREWARSIVPTIAAPFASLVWSPRGVTGVVFQPEAADVAQPVSRVHVIGAGRIDVLEPPAAAKRDDQDLDDRQIRALGQLGNKRLRGLQVGVVGVGGTGSLVAEQLVRVGVAGVALIDPDVIDDRSNLRRVVGSRMPDLQDGAPRKVGVVARHLQDIGLETEVLALPIDVRLEQAGRTLLDCDVVVNTTDTHSSRAMLNQLAYQFWLPVIDVGLRVGTKLDGTVSGMPVEVRILLPDNGCLWCRGGVLDAQRIYEENLPADERTKLAAEGYVQGLAGAQPSLTPLNHLAASIAVLTLVRLYAGVGEASAALVFDAWQGYVHPLAVDVDPACLCRQWRGRADQYPMMFPDPAP